ANARAARARWRPGAVTSAAAPNRTSAVSAGARSRGCATFAATTSASSGGSARPASTRCAAPSDAAPLTTASSVAPAPKSAVSRSHGPGLADTGTSDSPSKITERPRAGDVRDTVKIPGRRRRGRVPLERVGKPRVVAGPRAAPLRLPDVHDEEQDADRHDPRADRRDEVVRVHEPVLVVREVPTRHTHQSEHVL